MKADTHPIYQKSIVKCSCGNSFVTGSTKASLSVELCSDCHPFYTGKSKILDTGGRIQRFNQRLAKSQR